MKNKQFKINYLTKNMLKNYQEYSLKKKFIYYYDLLRLA